MSAPVSLRDSFIMLIENPESVHISFLPGLGVPAEMQDRCVLHHPVHIAETCASQQIVVEVAGVVIPDRIVDLKNAVSIHGV